MSKHLWILSFFGLLTSSFAENLGQGDRSKMNWMASYFKCLDHLKAPFGSPIRNSGLADLDEAIEAAEKSGKKGQLERLKRTRALFASGHIILSRSIQPNETKLYLLTRKRVYYFPLTRNLSKWKQLWQGDDLHWSHTMQVSDPLGEIAPLRVHFKFTIDQQEIHYAWFIPEFSFLNDPPVSPKDSFSSQGRWRRVRDNQMRKQVMGGVKHLMQEYLSDYRLIMLNNGENTSNQKTFKKIDRALGRCVAELDRSSQHEWLRKHFKDARKELRKWLEAEDTRQAPPKVKYQ